MGLETVSLFTQFGPGVGIFVLLLVLLYKLRDRVGSAVDDSVVAQLARLSADVKSTRDDLNEERDRNERYRAARERRDAVHRRWDSHVLRLALSGGDVNEAGDPPSLTPDPSEYELERTP